MLSSSLTALSRKKERIIVAPSGREYVWEKETDPTDADWEALKAFDAQFQKNVKGVGAATGALVGTNAKPSRQQLAKASAEKRQNVYAAKAPQRSSTVDPTAGQQPYENRNTKTSAQSRKEINDATKRLADFLEKNRHYAPASVLSLISPSIAAEMAANTITMPAHVAAELATFTDDKESGEVRARAAINILLATGLPEAALLKGLGKLGSAAFKAATKNVKKVAGKIPPIEAEKLQEQTYNVAKEAVEDKFAGLKAELADIVRKGGSKTPATPNKYEQAASSAAELEHQKFIQGLEQTVQAKTEAPKGAFLVDDPQKFATSNAASNDLRKSVGLGDVQPTPRPLPDESAYDPALTLAKVKAVVSDVSKGGRAPVFTDAENVHIRKLEADLKTQYNDLTEKINRAIAEGTDHAPLSQMRDDAMDAINATTQAMKFSGTEWSAAGRARNVAIFEDYTPAGLYKEWTATAGKKLDPEYQKLADELGIKNTELQQRIAILEDSLNARQAAENVATVRKVARTQNKERIKTEIDDLWKELARETSKVSSGINPALYSTLGRIALKYAELGVTTLDEVVEAVLERATAMGLKVTRKDVVDAVAGNYDKPKPTVSEIALRKRQIVGEAKRSIAAQRKAIVDEEKRILAEAKNMVADADRSAKQKTIVLAKKMQREAREKRLAQEKALRAEQQAWERAERQKAAADRKEYRQFWRDSVEGQREKMWEQIENLEERIRTGDVTTKPKPKPPKELTDLIAKKKSLEIEADNIRARIKAEKAYAEMGVAQKIAAETWNASRTLVASTDLSALLNQGAFFAKSRPVSTARAARDMIAALKSPEKLRELQGAIRSSEYYDKARAAGLELRTSDLDSADEFFVSKLLEKPIGSDSLDVNPLAASQRAYTAFLNKMRMDVFENMVKSQERPWFKLFGQSQQLGIDELKQIAEYVNTATGVGTGRAAVGLKQLNNALPVMFAPGYRISRWKLAFGSPMFNAMIRKNPKLATTILADYAKYTGVSVASLYGMKLSGYDVDLDPRSTNFGKTRLGDTYADFGGGLLTPYRVATQTTVGYKNKSGSVSDPRGAMQLGNYAASGLHPAFGTTLNTVTGKAFGKSYDPNTPEGVRNIALSFLPIQVQTQIDLSEDEKLTPEQKAVLRIAAVFGANVNMRR